MFPPCSASISTLQAYSPPARFPPLYSCIILIVWHPSSNSTHTYINMRFKSQFTFLTILQLSLAVKASSLPKSPKLSMKVQNRIFLTLHCTTWSDRRSSSSLDRPKLNSVTLWTAHTLSIHITNCETPVQAWALKGCYFH